ncbi:MAG: hypothetical protein IKP88_12765 [Lachnospiraceae bacterium]|nr:hypothetical protein [Lachnospiraceae bacterium]
MMVVTVIGFFNLFDFIYSEFITKSGYEFAVTAEVVFPALVAAVMGYLLFLRKKD